jgi:hypothetical protein
MDGVALYSEYMSDPLEGRLLAYKEVGGLVDEGGGGGGDELIGWWSA